MATFFVGIIKCYSTKFIKYSLVVWLESSNREAISPWHCVEIHQPTGIVALELSFEFTKVLVRDLDVITEQYDNGSRSTEAEEGQKYYESI